MTARRHNDLGDDLEQRTFAFNSLGEFQRF